jgi:hypothetical protein
LTLAGDVAGLRGAGWCPGWFPAAAGMVISCPAGGGRRAGDGAGRLLGRGLAVRLVFAAVRRPPWG